LREGEFVHGIEYGYSSTYVLVDEADPQQILGYATLTLDGIRLSSREREVLGRPRFPDFGAIKVAQLGVDHRHQQRGHGETILRTVIGLTMKISHDIAVRFLLADANVRLQAWYEKQGWVLNRAERYAGRPTVSMRFDIYRPPSESLDAATVMQTARTRTAQDSEPCLAIAGPRARDGVRIFRLESNRISVGRSPDSDLALRDDTGVSQRHALFVRSNGGWSVHDDRSQSGVFVNGERVKESMLHDGDEIQVGKYRIYFVERR
jgi:hypothetical protein